MRITLNLDEALLDRVVRATGAATRTEAITFALREVDRRDRLVSVLRDGMGASRDELMDMFDGESDPLTLRVAESGRPYGDDGRADAP